MSLAGVGVDIVDVKRMEKTLKRTPAFAKRIFTDSERHYCEHKARPAEHYAARFAAREAVLKALGTGFSGGVGLRDVSVVRADSGKPVVHLEGKVKEIADEQGVIEIALSLSTTREVAVANAVAVTEESKPHIEEPQEDAAKLLAKSFRNACSVLDELDSMQ